MATKTILMTACWTLALAATAAEPLVTNPSFEADGTAVKGVGYVAQGNPISGWDAKGDGQAARVPAKGAFHDNGAIPDGQVVVALQNRVALSQTLGPLAPDRLYRLRLRATGRAADLAGCGRYGRLEVHLNHTPLLGPVEVTPVAPAGQFDAPFRTLEAVFTTGGGRLRLDLLQVGGEDGVSVLVDDIRVEPLPAGEPEPATLVRVNRARVRADGEPVTETDFRQVQWIWAPGAADPREKAPAGTCGFRRTFDLAAPAAVKRAFLVGACDNRGEVSVNGTHLGTLAGFGAWYEVDFTACLRAGRNVLAVEGVNAGDEPNPAGLAGVAILVGQDGRPLLGLRTDAEWRCAAAPAAGWTAADLDDTGWAPAAELGAVGCSPWGDFGFLTWLVPPDFPEFRVPGQERHMELLRQLFWLHYPPSGPLATLWDGWMSISSLWPATGAAPGANDRRGRWRQALLGRRIDEEGYVSTHQHHGFGHGEGWPFPTWQQGGGSGWQFATAHLAYRHPATRDLTGWDLRGIDTVGIDEGGGWSLRVTDDTAAITPPAFEVDSTVAPLIRLEWAPEFPAGAEGELQWTTRDAPEFGADRRLPLRLQPDGPGGTFTHVALYRHPGWSGALTRLRLTFRQARGGTARLLGLCTAMDTRHTVNNPCYLQGCTEYANWTGDVGFLRENLGRMRTALAFAIREFRVEENGCVAAPWVGHDGRSGLTVDAGGRKTVHPGRGIGANYWDLLPFSGQDCLATAYLLDALRRMARLEDACARHPEWGLPPPPPELAAARLQALAERVAERSRELFWNPETRRFAACVDTTGARHDYGYTFVNNEAIVLGLASPTQARDILDWLCGRRTVAGDTATGDDIYHFRFGPRATTRRNIEWYTFVWSGPEGIPWGGQVQDGGAVLGFAYHDQMARLLTAGPDDAWAALRRTLDWFADVRAEGGYRAYYSVPGRGTLQGGGPPGGLGMDCEFFESLLVPQLMLYGFLGFQAEPDSLRLDPRLPADWPELTVTRVHYRNVVLDIRATRQELQLTGRGPTEQVANLMLPTGWTIANPDPPPTAPAAPAGSVAVRLGRDRVVTCRRTP